LLIHDLKINCWYKFTHPGLSGVSILNGTNESLISFAGGQTVKYDEKTFGPDILGGLDIEVQASLETGSYSNPTFSLLRLRKIWLYLTTIQGEVELSIVTDEGEASAVFTFDDETQRIKVLPTSGMETPVDFCRKFAFKISGAGIKKLEGAKLELRRVRE